MEKPASRERTDIPNCDDVDRQSDTPSHTESDVPDYVTNADTEDDLDTDHGTDEEFSCQEETTESEKSELEENIKHIY